MNKSKMWLLFAILIIGGLGIYYNGQMRFEAKETQMKLQEQCSNATKEFLTDKEWAINVIDYTNHYNLKLNKCFIFVKQRFSDASGFSEYLYDVLEHKKYAYVLLGSTGFDYCSLLNSGCK